MCSLCSNTSTSASSRSRSAVSRPAGPAPTTATRRETPRRLGRIATGSAGRPMWPGGPRSGLTEHSRTGSLARQSSLHEVHGRTVRLPTLKDLLGKLRVGDQWTGDADHVGAQPGAASSISLPIRKAWDTRRGTGDAAASAET